MRKAFHLNLAIEGCREGTASALHTQPRISGRNWPRGSPSRSTWAIHLPAWDSGLLMGLSRRHTPGSYNIHCTRTTQCAIILIILQYWKLKMESAKNQVHVMTSTDATTLILSNSMLYAHFCFYWTPLKRPRLFLAAAVALRGPQYCEPRSTPCFARYHHMHASKEGIARSLNRSL